MTTAAVIGIGRMPFHPVAVDASVRFSEEEVQSDPVDAAHGIVAWMPRHHEGVFRRSSFGARGDGARTRRSSHGTTVRKAVRELQQERHLDAEVIAEVV
jgi:hypothetical protein